MKRIISILLCVLTIFSLSIPCFAIENPYMVLFSKDETTGTAIVRITNVTEPYTIYKTVDSNKTKVATVSSDNDVRVSFGYLSCTEKLNVIVSAVDENEETRCTLRFDMQGAHKTGEWKVEKKASCEATGTSNIKCTICDKVLDSKILPATGHVWDNPSWTWSESGGKVTANFICKNDNTEVRNITTLPVLVGSSEPTCSNTGTKTFQATVELNNKTYNNTKSFTVPKLNHSASDWIIEKAATCTEDGKKIQKCVVCNDILNSETIPKTGHKYKISYVWNNDTTSCTATAKCAYDETHIITETVKGTDKILKKATCSEPGKLERKATFNNTLFSNQTKTATILSSHIDDNKDSICDVCKYNLTNPTPTPPPASLFEKIFGNGDTTTTTTTTTILPNTPQTPIIPDDNNEITTSLKFEEPSTTSDNTENKPEKEENTKSKVLVIVLIFLGATFIGVGTVYFVIKRDKKKQEI